MNKLPPVSKVQTARLDRLLANLGYGSRKEVQWLVAEGLVTLDGAVLPKSDQRLSVTADLGEIGRAHV